MGWLRALLAQDQWILRHPSVLNDSFSLRTGRRYRLRKNTDHWPRGTTIRFVGTHQEPDDRLWVSFFDFESPGQEIASLSQAQTPRTIGQSYALFDDVAEAADAQWLNPLTMSGLHHRAVRCREWAAEKVQPATHGLQQILPELVQQALDRGASDNAFRSALQRVGDPAREAAEIVCASLPVTEQRNAHRLLAHLGSHLYWDEYLALLADADTSQVRFAIARLADIGDANAIPAIQTLLDHPHLNVQFDARQAITRLSSL